MNLLVAVDFSEVSGRVLELAKTLGQALSAKVWVVHVAAPDPDFVGYGAGPKHVRDGVAAEFHREHKAIQAGAAELERAGLDATAILVQGPTAETILHLARERKADLIVVGSHGHGAVYQMLVGSVSEGVLRGASCPVLVVPARGEGGCAAGQA